MTAIRKVVITEFGGIDVLRVVDSTCPAPPEGHMQIATEYVGFNGSDTGMRQGIYPDMVPAPLTPGYCLVGTIRALGPNCSSGLQVGSRVAVLTKYDAEAELVNQPERYCIAVPDGVDVQQATALLCDWSTAYAMVAHVADVKSGQRVFVHGLSGAVGYAIMALCRLRGAHVYGTASLRNHDALRALDDGGVVPFVYTDKKWMEAMNELGGAHVVFDPLGYESFDESYDVLTPDGVLVAYGFNKDLLDGSKAPRSRDGAIQQLTERSSKETTGKRIAWFGLSRDSPTYMDDVKTLMEMVWSGAVKVQIKQVWPMEDIQTAHREWGVGHGIGSLLLKVSKT